MTYTYTFFFLTNLAFIASFILIFISLILTITRRNPISAVLFLILFFINLTFLFIFCGADYFGVLFLMIYGGAISIILLFVIMFLDLKDILLTKERFSYFLLFLLIGLFLFFLVKLLLTFFFDNQNFMEYTIYVNWAKVLNYKTTIEILGIALFKFYLFQFIIIGLLLFLIMVIIISLIINYNAISKKQIISKQLKFKNNVRKTD
jgi:NADH-quinone oxidoreductase subunit J